MQVNNINLINFRNYENLSLDFSPNINMIIGQNGQGKTNIVEAVHFLSFAKSFRTNKDKEVINFEGNTSYIKSIVTNKADENKIDIKISKDSKKAINVDNIPISKISDLMGIINVVVFSPEDTKIVSDSPIYRRNFMDKEISQIRPVYYNLLLDYNKTLNNKNTLLKSQNIDMIMLDIYDEQLADIMEKIITYRDTFIKTISEIAKETHYIISSKKENLLIEYKSNLKSSIKSDILSELKDARAEDIRHTVSTKGIHKDDIMLKIGDIDIRKYGSQGQKKTATISLKLSEIELIHNMKKEYPIVILDDIFSELDITRRMMLVEKLYNIQTFITTTEKIDINKDIKYFEVKDRNVLV
ncbi:MAG: DNA replication/repair protein RecF [Peptoanaerobacter stomatis]|uniref:DNA replication/repair protein RecF n=1 Tax=Peptoanaerobacter stomatis TaxID=796937 RepID=UPI003F9EF693